MWIVQMFDRRVRVFQNQNRCLDHRMACAMTENPSASRFEGMERGRNSDVLLAFYFRSHKFGTLSAVYLGAHTR
jgi:hypothetical protein